MISDILFASPESLGIVLILTNDSLGISKCLNMHVLAIKRVTQSVMRI